MSSRNSPITIPKGFRFHPSDEELLTHYLKKKNQGKDSEIISIIPEISVCKHEPRDLPALVFAGTGFLDMEWFTAGDTKDMEWYLFNPRHRKYSKGTRSNRTTAEGYWKPTTKSRGIKAPGSNTEIGRKKIMTFYQRAEPKPKKTDWVMHEYYLTQAPSNDQIGDFVLCRQKKKSDKNNKKSDKKDVPVHDETETGSGSGGSSTVENQDAESTGMITQAQENQVNILNKDECNGSSTDSCLAENPSNLDSSFNLPPQLHQPSQTYQPQLLMQGYPQLGTHQLHQPSQTYQPQLLMQGYPQLGTHQLHQPSQMSQPQLLMQGYPQLGTHQLHQPSQTSQPQLLMRGYPQLGTHQLHQPSQTSQPQGYPQLGTHLGSLPIQ